MTNQAIWLSDTLRNGSEVCDFPSAAASNWMKGFLYNHRVRVR